ncbi:nicotinate-nucleotide adenylyltransferase [Stenotrophomonas terrae]|uniref:nicotinate-nucleotide adenylyltransferase n=1 Tax=Stenotrophomonas terrae TaxID=405446 RepID=UPI001FCE1BF0|nr:nicotinate-nucleotide adenylyltransferase [Stenotrophomonas terrae]
MACADVAGPPLAAAAGQQGLWLLYGGTFDPVHNGHLAIARCAAAELQVPVHLMPAADPPHRAPPGANAAQRARMLELAVAGEAMLQVDTRELQRAVRQPGVPSWTVDTLREIRAQIGPQRPLAMLMGADSLLGLPSWHEWEHLLDLAHIVVAERPGSGLDGPLPEALALRLQGAWAQSVHTLADAPAGRVWRLRQPLHAESATALRALIANGGQWRDLLPSAVAEYILAQGLYGSAAAV